jgi:pimeloyl-ACP methyl ester carboxylesterase
MYRNVTSPTLIIRCTDSGAPPVLDDELDALVEVNPWVNVVRLNLTHLAPAWDPLDEVAEVIARFFEDNPAPM